MTDARSREVSTGADLRWVRGVTAMTLVLLVLIGGFLQMVLGLERGLGDRLHLLILSTITSIVLALAIIPFLLGSAAQSLTARSFLLLLALVVSASCTWVLAWVPPFAGWGWGFLFAIAGGICSCVVTHWWRVGVLLATLGALALGGVAASQGVSPLPGGTEDADNAGSIVLIGTLALMVLAPLSTVWVPRVALRLDEARRTAAELAVATERLRFATDLHDIQGHHLQVIALKGELAERRLVAGDTSLAAAELSEIRSIAQAALEDTRAVVHDYRAVTVAGEARNAAGVLRSAGIACTARIDAPDLGAEAGRVVALGIREGATNILRHSDAQTAVIELSRSAPDAYTLSVTNDGARPRRGGGNGISGLAARAATLHGVVSTERHADRFTLTIRIPAHAAQIQEARE